MTSNDRLRRAVRYALFANAAATAGLGVAAAATTTATVPNDTPAPTPVLEEVVVTGSRISQPGLEAISPITTVSSEEIKAQGTVRIEDLLNNLPQVFADQGSNISNGATGTATVNLRGLGPQRTLVLINGRRLMPGDPTTLNGNFLPDLNQIPVALVDRVDVLTGGASAVYGADAVAGVVNFMMNDHFQGVRVDANATMYNHTQHNGFVNGVVTAAGDATPSKSVNDGKTKDITFIMGSNFADDKGNVTAYAGYRRTDPIAQSQRDFSACTLQDSSKNPSCGGSHTSATGGFLFAANTANGFSNALLGNPYATIGANGTVVPFSQGAGTYNYAPTNYYQRADERWTGGLFGHYDFNEHNQAYSEVMFMNDRSVAQVAASGAFLGSGTAINPVTGLPDGAWQTNCDNPLLSASEVTAFCGGSTAGVTQLTFGRRNIEGGPRIDDLTHTSFRIVVGARGDFLDAWKYDIYGLEGRTEYSDVHLNDISKSRLTNALQVDPTTGGCLNTAATGCVPYNIWSNGQVTPAALAYISVPSLITGVTEERIISASVTGDLGKYGVKFPTANSGLAVVVGGEYRSEAGQLQPDAENISNDLTGNGNPILPLAASFHVGEFFTEERLPILQDQPFAKELSFETGYRYSDYTVGFKTNTYKFGVDYAPVSDVRLRASFQHAVRAPNLRELFTQRYIANDLGSDPCATSSGSPPTASATACARTGVSAAQYGKIVGNSAGQYNGFIGGNPTLKPESSDTKSFGIVFTPTILPGLNFALDYFDINVKNVINSYGASYTLNQCLTTGDSQFCNLVHRDATGSLWLSTSGYVDDPTLNLGSLQTRGADFTGGYHLDAGNTGKFAFDFSGTYTASLIYQTLPGGGSYDCAGYYGNTCGTPTPKWRHRLRTTWMTPFDGLDFSMQWRHINSVIADTESPNALLSGATRYEDTKLGSRDYLDLSASYQFYKGMSVRVGVNNVLDKDPPILAGGDFSNAFVNGNTYPQVYDTLGRYMFLNVTANF
ncbi:MAG: TonB-dependent receptor [Pseudomonadota bacterium]|nr:TonB-dependent receptor [Pseudomonadota bacterium]